MTKGLEIRRSLACTILWDLRQPKTRDLCSPQIFWVSIFETNYIWITKIRAITNKLGAQKIGPNVGFTVSLHQASRSAWRLIFWQFFVLGIDRTWETKNTQLAAKNIRRLCHVACACTVALYKLWLLTAYCCGHCGHAWPLDARAV